MTCPKCRGEMGSRRVAVDAGGWWSGVRVSSIELDVCGACGGAWFDGGEWSAYLRRRLEAMEAPAALNPERRDTLDSQVADCPRCGVFLEKKRRRGATVDLCGGCGGLWLDSGEYPSGENDSWEKTFKRLLLQ